MPRRVSSAQFVGRSGELAILDAALERAERGEPSAVFLAGDSGVGKSRLLAELEQRALARGARVLRGDCVSFGAGEVPYAPIGGALRALLRQLEPAAVDEILGAARDDLARLLPELAPSRPSAGHDTSDRAAIREPLAQARLFGLLLGLLDRLSLQAPVVLGIEDLHWADRSTLEFLSSLLRGVRTERLLLICTYRSDEIHRRHPLRPFLVEEERRAIVTRIQVPSLSLTELAVLLTAILGEPPDPALVRRLHERSEGNPFFAEELLAASEEGEAPLPANLRDTLGLRLDVLPEESRHVLRVVAASGRRLSHRLLAAVVALPEPELLDALRSAVAHHVLIGDDDGYAFRHALLQETAYGDLLPGERTALHVALAEAMIADPTLAESTTGSAAAQLAQHWRAAHRLPEALAASVRAGLEAERVYAFAEAARHLETALELWDRVDGATELAGMDHAAVLAHAAEDVHLTGDDQRAVAVGREAARLVDLTGDRVRAALARERLGRYLWVSGHSDDALEAYRAAVELMPPGEPRPELALVLAAEGQILMLRGHIEESRARCERAIAIARRVGARAVEGHALNTLGVCMATTGDRAGAARTIQAALAIAQELDESDDQCRVYVNLGDIIDQDGRVLEAIEMAREGARVAKRLGLQAYTVFLEGEVSLRLVRLGRLDEAHELALGALPGSGGGLATVILRIALGQVALIRGRFDEAAEHMSRTKEHLAGVSDSMWLGPAAHGRVEIEVWRGRPEPAWQDAAGSLAAMETEYVFYTGGVHALAARAAADLAGRARATRDEGGAAQAVARVEQTVQRLAELLKPELWHAGPPPADSLAYELVAAAELTRARGSSDALAWAAAAARMETLGYRFDVAYCRWRQAEALVTGGGDRAVAGELLGEAAEIARDLGAAPLAAEIEGLAQRARISMGDGASAPDATGIDRLGLTEREHAVLALVAEGKTNREIGETLFISEKTASVHVSRILAKLGVRSRVEAATAAHHLGLTTGAR